MGRTEDRSRTATGPLRTAIEAGEARFRGLIEAGADGLIVVVSDGTIAFANPAACLLMGRNWKDLIGRPFGIPIVPGESTEVDIPRSDGEIRIAEMRASATDWRGVTAYLASLRDITERKQAEEAAREAHSTLRSFYNGAPMRMGVVEILDDDIVFVSSNAATARFFGQSVDEIAGQTASRLGMPSRFLGLWIESYRSAELAGTPIRFEYEHDASTAPAWLSATVNFIGHAPDGRSRFSFVVEDVTERKRAEQAIQEADSRKNEFLAMLAHELRNPLAAISNAIQLASRTGHGELESWSREIIGRQCGHLSRLIDDLMDISRIGRGQVRLRMERLDASTILHSSVESVRALIEQRRHEITTSFPSSLWVEADPTRLEQIVVNLLTNAAKYTEAGGHIRLTAGLEGKNVVIRVRDNGIGIPPEQIPEMFQLFVQGERHISRSEGGLGIGLTLVRKLAEHHGGDVTAHSDGIGRGSEFVVTLPASKAPEPILDKSGASSTDSTSRLRILVVDDNQDAACLMATLLQTWGHKTQTVFDGSEALGSARDFQPDVVLLDLGLPGMDGYQVCSALRRDKGFRGRRIIAVSGYGEEQALRKSKEAGFDHHLVKPVDIEVLLKLLTRPEA